MNVLVTGAGGPAAVGAIRALRRGGFCGRIVAADADPLSAGRYLADTFRVLPRAADPGFFEAAVRLIEDEKVQLILPTSGFDIYPFALHKEELRRRGVVAAMSDFDTMVACGNKWEFFLRTRGAFPLPETSRDPQRWEKFPCFVKPMLGKGSRNSHRCRDREELEFYASRGEEMIVQEYLPGEEYTVDVLSDLGGKPVLAVARVRLETKEGISSKGRVVRDAEIEGLALAMAAHLRLKGPTCMQLRRDGEGRPRFLEVNARMGGGTIFAALAGVNIPMLLLDLVTGMEIAPPPPREVTVVRYYEELVVEAAG